MSDDLINIILEKSICSRCSLSVYREWVDIETGEDLCDFMCIPTQADLMTHIVNYCTMYEEDETDNIFLRNKFLGV